MRYVARCLSVALALLLLGASAASAQHLQTRNGFFVGFGLGYGSLGFSCQGCASNREGALSGYLKMGGTLSPKLLLGGELNGWTKDDGTGSTVTTGNASFSAYFYPAPAGGFFLKGGLGFATLKVEGLSGETGLGFILGGGYDVRLGTNVSLTPYLNLNWGHPVDGLSQNIVQMGLGVTFH